MNFDHDPVSTSDGCDGDGGQGTLDCYISQNCAFDDGGCCAATWSIEGADLGTTIDTNTGKITPGTEEGYITVRATMTNIKWGENGPHLFAESKVFVGNGGSCSGGGCGPGQAIIKPGSVDVRFGLGKGQDGKSVGQMWLHDDVPNADLYTPKGLNYNVERNDVQIDRSGPYATISQITTPEVVVLVDYTDPPSKYTIHFYHRDAVGNQATSPFVSWQIENPAAQPSSDFTQLKITKKVGNDPKLIYEYQYADGSFHKDWTLRTKDPEHTLKQEFVTWTASSDSICATPCCTTSACGSNPFCCPKERQYVVTGEDENTVVQQVLETYVDYGWGDVMVSSVVDPNGSPQTTTRTFYQDSDGTGKARRLKSIKRPDGSWNRYDYDSLGRTLTIGGPFEDQTMPTGGAGVGNSKHKTSYDYTTISASDHNDDNESAMANRPRTIKETLEGGQVVSKTYHVYYHEQDGDYVEIEEQVPHLVNGEAPAYGYSGNLRTQRWYQDTKREKPTKIQYPDGRVDVYSYADGAYSFNSSSPGSSSFTSGTGSYRLTTVQHGYLGSGSTAYLQYKSTRERTVSDLRGWTYFEATDVYDGSNWQQVEWTSYDLDEAGRATTTYRSDGTVSRATWGCCSEESTVDETGTETTYEHDALGRLTKSTKKGATNSTAGYPDQADIVTEYKYDAMGRLLETKRHANGIDPLITSTEYDGAGRIKKTWDEANLMTEYTYSTTSNGGRQVTVTHPDGGTEITAYYRDGQIKSAGGTAVVARYYDYDILATGGKMSIVTVGPGGLRWEKTWTDMVGNKIFEIRPGYDAEHPAYVQAEYIYNSKGQLFRILRNTWIDTSPPGNGGGNGQIHEYDPNLPEFVPTYVPDPGLRGGGGGNAFTQGSVVLYKYDDLGNLYRQGVDRNNNLVLDDSSTDRISETNTSYVFNANQWWLETANKVYTTENNGTATVTGRQRHQLTGLPDGNVVSRSISYDAFDNPTVSTRAIDFEHKVVTETVDTPDSTTDAVTITYNGLVQRSTSATGATQTYEYDNLGRQWKVHDGRHASGGPNEGKAETHYDEKGRVECVEDAAGDATNYAYDTTTGRLKSMENADGKKTYYGYDLHGRTTRVWGDVPQPVSMGYDDYGQRTTLTTYRGGTNWNQAEWPGEGQNGGSHGTGDVTTWLYHAPTGLLLSKKDAANQMVQYQYTAGGAIQRRYWARGEGIGSYTEYEYDSVTGDLLEIGYGPSTPGMSFTYDRLGRLKTATDLDYSVHIFAYSGVQLTSETVDGMSLDYVLTPTYQTSTNAANGQLAGRPASLGVGPSSSNSTGWYNTTYGYDSSGRFKSVAGPGLPSGGKAEYSRVTGTNNEPLSDLIAKVEIKNSGGDVIASTIKSYEGQRDLITSVENVWGSIGVPPVSTVSKYEYQNDGLARRTSVVRTGSAFTGGTGDHQELYTYNARNELIGATTYAGATLGSPGDEIVARRRVYDYDPIGNRLTHANGDDDNTSYTSNNLNQYTEICPPPLPPVCAEPTYDADGNLTGDANWNYYWDLENRLSFVVAKTPGEGAKYYQYDYDYMNRRIRKRTFEWVCPEPREGCVCGVYSGSCEVGQWNTAPSQDIRYVYDGWNLLMEIDALNNNTVIRKYTWGLDLSGTMQGAGGIGGLLATEGSIGGSPVKYLYCYDANGNVGQLVDLSDGSIMAKYEYDPYGNMVASGGSYDASNPFRFSTKYFDAASDMYYYGRRFYAPRWGRWGNRDPNEERGDIDLNRFSLGDPINHVDFLGLYGSIIRCSQRRAAILEQARRTAVVQANWLDFMLLISINQDHGQYPLFTRWKLGKARSRLACAKAHLLQYTLKCECDGGICNIAYAWVNTRPHEEIIHICPLYFNGVPSRFDRNQFWGATLVHEATHTCGTNDASYFWQFYQSPHDVGFSGYQDIASTYDTWILTKFCIPGYDCP